MISYLDLDCLSGVLTVEQLHSFGDKNHNRNTIEVSQVEIVYSFLFGPHLDKQSHSTENYQIFFSLSRKQALYGFFQAKNTQVAIDALSTFHVPHSYVILTLQIVNWYREVRVLGNIFAELERSLHLCKNKIDFNSIQRKFSKRNICCLDWDIVLDLFYLLQFCLKNLVKLDTFEETVKRGDQEVKVRIRVINTKESWTKFDELIAWYKMTALGALCILVHHIEPTHSDIPLSLILFYLCCHDFLENLMKNRDGTLAHLLRLQLKLLVNHECLIVIVEVFRIAWVRLIFTMTSMHQVWF